MTVTQAKAAKGRADRLFSLLIRATKGRDGCQNCGSFDNLQCAHIIGRSFNATRVLEDNAYALCGSCHWLFTNNAIEWGAFIERTIGISRFHELWELARTPVKVDWPATATQLRLRYEQVAA